MTALLDTCAVLWAAREPMRFSRRPLQARILPIRLEHIAALQQLPPYHRDPFDRLLIAQAVAEHLTLLTADKAITNYPEIQRVW